MEEQNVPQYARVVLPAGIEPPKPHCPICGKKISDIEGDGLTPCPHLAFVHFELNEDGMEYMSDDFKKRTSAMDRDFDLEDFPEYLQEAGYGNNLLAIEMCFEVQMCAATWITDVYGFDYNTMEQDQQEEEA